jgi:hypothetical protein
MIQIVLKEPPNSPSKYGKNNFNKHVKKKHTSDSTGKNIIAKKKHPPPVSPLKTFAAKKKGSDRAGTSETVLAAMLKKREEEDEGLEHIHNESVIKKMQKKVNDTTRKNLNTKTTVREKTSKEDSPWKNIPSEKEWLDARGLEWNTVNWNRYVEEKRANRKKYLKQNFEKQPVPAKKKKSPKKKANPKSKTKVTRSSRRKPTAAIIPMTELRGVEPYEVEPLYDQPTEVVNEDDPRVIGEWTAHDSILNHRKRVGEEPELLVKFDNGVQVWTLVDNAVVDSKEDLEDYFVSQRLNNTAMVTSTLKRVRQHEDDEDKKKMEKNKDKLFYNEKDKSVECKHNHNQWELEIGYTAEGNSKYCSENRYMANFECAVCSASFMSIGHTVDGHTFRPTNREPAYVCINHLQGCKQAACYKCFHKKNKEVVGSNKRSRRSTRSTH